MQHHRAAPLPSGAVRRDRITNSFGIRGLRLDYRKTNERNVRRLQGQAGVYRVASELLLRGYNPSFPSVDVGADLVVDGGIRIQVKCAHVSYGRCSTYKKGAYWFKLLGRTAVVTGSNTIRHRAARVFSEECDFVILWGIEENRFWVVPSAHLDGHVLVVVGPDIQYVSVDPNEIDRLYASGMTQQQIADKMNVSASVIWTRLNGKHRDCARTISSKVRECESRWDLIGGCSQSLCEATEVVAAPKED